MKRFHATILGAGFALFALALLHPTMALADISLTDPTSGFAGLGAGWFTELQKLAAKLYGGLFTLEVIVVCVQGALYKDNIAEFFQGFAFKILTATVMLAVIGNAGTIFPAIVGLFQTTATTVVNGGSSSGNCSTISSSNSGQLCTASQQVCADTTQAYCTATAIANPAALEINMLGWAAQYFLAADLSRAADSAESAIAGIVVFGTGVPGLSTAFLMGHENYSLFCIAMGMTCVMSAAGILLTFTLLTFETQIVMMIGVIYLAFQGSRYTAQFSQGYMSYCINIGTKFFVFYFMVSILQQITSQGNQELAQSILSLIGGAVNPFGAGSIALVAASSNIPVICVISSVLVAAIPNFAGSLLQGSSALSASAALSSGAVQSMTGAVGQGMTGQGGGGLGKGAGSGASHAGGGSGGGGGADSAGMSGGAGGGDMAPSQNVQLGPQDSGGGGDEAGVASEASGGGATGDEASLYSGGGGGSQNGAGGGGYSQNGAGGGGGDGDDAMSYAAGGAEAGAMSGYGSDDDTSMGGDGGAQLGDDYGAGSGSEDGDADSSGEGDYDTGTGGSDDTPQGQDADAAANTDNYDKSLAGVKPDQLAEMSPDELQARMEHTNFNDLSDDQKSTIMENPDLRSAAVKGFASQALSSAMPGGSAPASASGGGGGGGDDKKNKIDWGKMTADNSPKGENPPPAVQIRVTNPDKL